MSRQDCTTKEYQRKILLNQLARTMETAAQRGLFGHPITLKQATLINGPRAGALEIGAGFESGALLRSLSSDDGATLRQLIPWEFSGEPSTFMSGRFVRIEAGWPKKGIADDDIPLRALGQHPTGGGRWLVGRNERGHVLTAGLNDDTPHWLVSGGTGSGKTTALISMSEQLCRDPENRLVLIDAKLFARALELESSISARRAQDRSADFRSIRPSADVRQVRGALGPFGQVRLSNQWIRIEIGYLCTMGCSRGHGIGIASAQQVIGSRSGRS